MQASTLEEWLSYLETLHPCEIDLGLERIREVAIRLQLLPFRIPSITVTGTNGKGSCVALLQTIFLEAGMHVGTYTSPHLLKYNERVVINGTAVADDDLCAAFQQIEAARGNLSLTYFEFGTLAALLLFSQAHVDLVILEVGLGGRLDAVNIVDADVAVISTIDLDHTQWLGNDREQIGYEKVGIFRPHQLAICGDYAVPNSVIDYAKRHLVLLHCINRDFAFEANATTWSWWNQNIKIDDLPLASIELQNAATVLAVIKHLPQKISQILPKPITAEMLKNCLRQVKVPGRYQVIANPVTIILDVAHNPAAGACLAKRLKADTIPGKTVAILGMLADKDHANTLRNFHGIIDEWFVVSLHSARTATAKQLAAILHQLGVTQIRQYDNVLSAYQAAMNEVRIGDRVVVFGSFLTVAAVTEYLLNIST